MRQCLLFFCLASQHWYGTGFNVAALRRRDVPPPFARFVRSTVLCHGSSKYHCSWESVDKGVSARVVNRFFNVKIGKHQSCEVFLVEGVPAACMLYASCNNFESPIVDAFHLNKGLLLLFDAGACMRKKLYTRYRRIDLCRATNKLEFLHC